MTYKVINVEYTCDICGKKYPMKLDEYYPSLETWGPPFWDWTSSSEYSRNRHCCEDRQCREKLMSTKAPDYEKRA